MKKMLICGGESMLGQYLAEKARGLWDVVLLSRADLDITDQMAVQKKVSEVKPDVIINCAAYNNVDKAETDDRELALKINGEAVGYLVQAAREVGATFVTFSSEYVFDGTKREGYFEIDRPAPISVYGQSKLEGEIQTNFQFSIFNFQSNPNDPMTKWYIIRTSRLFGKKGPGVSSKQSFPDKLIELYKGGKTEFDLVDAEVSSPTYVADLARAVLELLQSNVTSGIYHRTNDGVCSWFEFGQEVFRLAGISAKLNPVPPGKFPRPARRPEWGILRSTKLPALRSWREALREYLTINLS